MTDICIINILWEFQVHNISFDEVITDRISWRQANLLTSIDNFLTSVLKKKMLVKKFFFSKSTKSKENPYSCVKYPKESLLKISGDLKKNLLQKEMGFIMWGNNGKAPRVLNGYTPSSKNHSLWRKENFPFFYSNNYDNYSK